MDDETIRAEDKFMFTQCVKCSEAIDRSGDGRSPPWCPRCGADLGEKSPTAPASAAPTGRNSDPGLTEVFDETRLLAIHDFSLRGYLHGKAGAGLMLVAIFLGIAGLLFAVALKQPGSGTMAPGLLTVGVAAAALVFTFAGYPKRIRRVEVFADGIGWHGPAGADRLAWRNVEAVYRFEVVFNGLPTSELKLVGRGGRVVVFDRTIERFRELAGFVQGHCAELMRPRKREEARTCGAEFGPVVVGPDGVAIEGGLIPWEHVAGHVISGGSLWIQSRGYGRKGIPLHTIPNAVVLFDLLEEFAHAPVGESAGLPVMAG
jgi:hypothetical protein